MATLRCRPSESEREPIMVFMSATQMLSLKLKNGDLCAITWKDQTTTAVSWLTAKADLKDGVIGVSRWLQDLCSIKLENKVSVEKAQSKLQDASSIPIESLSGEIPDSDVAGWSFIARTVITGNHRYLVAGQRFFAVVDKQKREFEVLPTASAEHNIYKVAESSQVEIRSSNSLTNGVGSSADVTSDDIGGLHRQKRLLTNIIHEVSQPDLIRDWHTVTQNARGVILWGPPRTGKTLLRRAVESGCSWKGIHEWHTGTAKTIPTTTGPQLVNIRLYTKPSESETKGLLKLFETHTRSTLVLLEIQDPNDLPPFLRNEDNFADEIEVTIPDAPARSEILSLIAKESLDTELLQIAASKTHGYVGGDLRRLVTETLRQARNDVDQDEDLHKNGTSTSDTNHISISISSPKPTLTHLTTALSKIRPSALQHIFLEKPTVYWTDIGGQSHLKRRLDNAVSRPLHHSTHLTSYGIPPTKGILLYGPPGCSKTMLVKALATESDYNFLAVKGAELLSMYVGESERATREVFRKARAASPCIVFFDEIDAIARRSGGSGGGGSDLNVLTTLLNELDGFEELRGVFVVAATNKPWSIDDAMLRPGRFDNVVYVGPPDLETRIAIFSNTLSRIPRVSAALVKDMEERCGTFAERTEGFSGADVVAVCQRAGEIAFERAERQNFVDAVEGTEELNVGVEDVLAAIEGAQSSITAGMIREYEEWNVERGKK